MKGRELLVLLSVMLPGATVHASPWPSGREAIELKARPFPLADVRLLDGPFKDAMERTRRYLHELESDRLLHFFRLFVPIFRDDVPQNSILREFIGGSSFDY